MKCPVCGKDTFFLHDDAFDGCDTCGWEHDLVQEDDPDYEGGANDMSLNQARAAWADGKQIQ